MMLKRITAMKERFEAFSLRERVLILGGVIVILFMLWDAAVMSPEELMQKQMISKMFEINQQMEEVNTQIGIMSKSIAEGESLQMQERIAELEELLETIKTQEKNLTLDFIRPEQMATALRDILEKDQSLVLTRLESLGSEPLFSMETEGEAVESGAAQVTQQATTSVEKSDEPAETQIYKHGIRVVLEGDFKSVLKYLKALEGMSWRLYWDNVEYQVLTYPKARIGITVHTLSLYEDWIGV